MITKISYTIHAVETKITVPLSELEMCCNKNT